jgi:hypothetical protein
VTTPSEPVGDLVAPELPEVSVLRVQPGDKIVVVLKQQLSAKQFDETTSRLLDQFPDNKILVVDGDAKLCVLREEAS